MFISQIKFCNLHGSGSTHLEEGSPLRRMDCCPIYRVLPLYLIVSILRCGLAQQAENTGTRHCLCSWQCLDFIFWYAHNMVWLSAKKINLFIWCARRYFLFTLLRLRGIPIASINCPICNVDVQDVDHALIRCSTAQKVWATVAAC